MNIKDWPHRLANLFQRADREITRPEVNAIQNDHAAKGLTVGASISTPSPPTEVVIRFLGAQPGESDLKEYQEDGEVIKHIFPSFEKDREARLQQQIGAWSGESVRDLNEMKLGMSLWSVYDEYRGVLKSENLLSTVPNGYRGDVWEAGREDSNPMEAMGNSLAGSRSSATIVAFDQQGQALVQSYVEVDYIGAEGWSFKVMPQQEAVALIDNYRGSHEIVKEFRSGLLPSNFNYPKDPADLRTSIMAQYREGDSLQEITPESGQTYRGDILHRTNDWIAQDIGEGRYVVHNAKCLVGAMPSLDAYSEIHYPRGQVGIVQEVTHGAELAMPSRQTSYGEHAL